MEFVNFPSDKKHNTVQLKGNKNMDVIKKLSLIGIVPVIALDKAEDASPLAGALCRGGLPCAEITFRTDAAEESIKIMHKEYPDMIIGAGTVLTAEQADRAIGAGASFIVSPGLNPEVVKHCTSKGYPIVPGCATPSEIELAMSLGLDTVKFFPAEAAGGIAMIKAMSAPYGKIKFMPTGGIGKDNLNDYLSFGKVFACGGSWMAAKNLINAGKYDEIEKITREAVSAMLDLKLHHIGINAGNEDAKSAADFFGAILGLDTRDAGISVWAGDKVEVMIDPIKGARGHIALSTNYVDRAVYHLTRRGMTFDLSTAKYDNAGNMTFVYAENEILGFAVHLLKKA